MEFILLVLSIIILLALLIVFLPLRVVFEYSDKMKFKVFVYGIKIYDNIDHKPDNEEKTDENKSSGGEKQKDKSAGDIIEHLKKNFEYLKEILLLIVEKAKKYAIIKNIEVKYRFGLGDAAVTGIYSGAVYSALNGFAAYIRNYFKIKNQHLEVTPDFDNKIQEFEAKIELVVRVTFFVPVFIRVLRLIRKKKEV